MAADHSARGSMKTGVKPETVCELQDTNDHRQVERKWRLPISVGKLSALEGRLTNLRINAAVDVSSSVVMAGARGTGRGRQCSNGVVSSANSGVVTACALRAFGVRALTQHGARPRTDHTSLCSLIVSTSGVLDYALNLSISLSAGKETKWDSPSNGE